MHRLQKFGDAAETDPSGLQMMIRPAAKLSGFALRRDVSPWPPCSLAPQAHGGEAGFESAGL
jgi:hypothetical protein